MPSFDFITGEDFRKTLQADNRELDACFESASYKATTVMAGSIIEAMLADALSEAKWKPTKSKSLLELTLHELVAAAKSEKVIRPETADMCSGVRQYRNLIHPGRSIREQTDVSRHNAEIARALVEVIAKELAERRQATYGLTAEQILHKLETDTSAVPIIPDLLKASNEHEQRRLLLEVLPDRYVQLEQEDFTEPGLLDGLSKAYRAVFRHAPAALQKEATERFVQVIKGRPREVVQSWETGLFRGVDLRHLDDDDRQTVKQYLLNHIASSTPTMGLLNATVGTGRYLTRQEGAHLVQGAMRYAMAAQGPRDIEVRRKFVSNLIEDAYLITPSEADEGMRDQLQRWMDHFRDTKQHDWRTWVESIHALLGGPEPVEEIDIDDIPF